MADSTNEWVQALDKTEERNAQVMDKVLAAAQPGAVYGAPVNKDGYTIITANEVMAGGGYGYGKGAGTAPPPPGETDQAKMMSAVSAGGGGGGGGYSNARPVAIIVMGPDGVDVKPIIDVTKLGIAGISAWIAIIATLRSVFKK